ncbi:hypothetical protein [Rahnella selenatireducens]|uniref:hypothetical protein n=1 Tax=Rahnella selenatireducens TaxID=3389797 RepID=UPI0039696CB5
MSIWSVLDIEPTDDLSIIKRAYARKLKTTRPDQDPAGYQRLREAFEQAKGYANRPSKSDVVTEILDESPSFTVRMPVHIEPLQELTPDIDDALEQELEASRPVTAIIDVMMEDETEGVNLLESVLSGDLLQNLRLREVFSQELAAQLSEREGLYSALLIRVSEIMGWDIDNYQPGGIPAHRLAALHRQIENTGAKYYLTQLQNKYQKSALDRQRLRLLTVEGTTLAWWARWMPDFLKPLYDELSYIRMNFPSLLPQINSQLVKALDESRAAMSWGTVFLTGFWLLLTMLATREDPDKWRDRILLIATIGVYTQGYSFLARVLRYRHWWLRVAEGGLSLLALLILAKMLLGFFDAFKPESGHLQMLLTNYGVMCVVGFCVLWMMAPKVWKWYQVPLNAMIILVVFPWQLMKKSEGIVGIVSFVLLLAMYAFLIALGIR